MIPIVSIIIPDYNAEKYIKSCIKSILRQTFSSWQLIIVDDGSTDQSGVICDRYAEKDSRISVIHQKNAGTIKARNCGIEASQTEFITFADADDKLYPNYLEFLLDVQRKTDADIVCGKSCTLSHHGLLSADIIANKKPSRISTMSGSAFSHRMAGSIEPNLWAKLYKKKVFALSDTELRALPSIFYGEDSLINAVVSLHANTVALSEQAIYYYRVGGFSSRCSQKTVSDLGVLYRWRKHFLIEANANSQYLKLNLCHVLNVMLYYAHYSDVSVERNNVLNALSEPINDISLYVPDYSYKYAYDTDVRLSDKEFCSIFQEKTSVKLKQFIMRSL